MTVKYTRADRQNLSLIIGISGATGSGKTCTALRLATGLAGGKPFAVIDTENGRAKHYAPLPGQQADPPRTFLFDHAGIEAPFTPDRYADAIVAADAAGYPVIVVDSASHEHAGDGGLLDMHDAFLDMKVENAKKYNDTRPEHKIRDANNMAAWIKPKTEHKRMVSKLLQVHAHIILCFRAEQKVEMVKGENGRWTIVPKQSLIGVDGWIPVAEKSLPYELTASILLVPGAPGKPQIIKVNENHRRFFPLDKVVNEETGIALGEWARGGTAPVTASPAPDAPKVASPEKTPGSAPIADEEQAPEPTPDPPEADPVDLTALERLAEAAAEIGYTALEDFWGSLSDAEKLLLKPNMGPYKSRAAAVDLSASGGGTVKDASDDKI